MIADALRALGYPGRAWPEPERVAGGDIHDGWKVWNKERRPVFVKTARRPCPGMFELEVQGLDALRHARSGLRVPDVLGWGESFLILSWIDRGAGGAAALGEGLAQQHRETAQAFGWDVDNWIGTLEQPNGRMESLPGFFGERRLRAQGHGLPWALRKKLDALIDRLPDLLPDEAPALLHGDLWSGNWMADFDGAPWVFDPAVHHGCREVDLAMTHLFGGFADEFYDAYEAAWPLPPGWRERTDLWNLHPLLVHANLFGGGYVAQVDRVLRRYLG